MKGNYAYNRIGMRYGRLLVIDREDNDKNLNSRWRCRCVCGNETIVIGLHLATGHTRSCGCLHIEACRAMGIANGRQLVAVNAG